MTEWLFLFTMLSHPSSCQLVSGDQILGADLARAVPVFGALPGDTVIGYAPAPGSRRVLEFAELQRLGARYRVVAPPDARACFEWKMQPITNDAVRAAIREALHAPEARVEILDMTKSLVPEGKLAFPPAGLSAAANTDPSTPVTWRGYVLYNSSRRFTVWARVKVSVATPRVVAVAPLAPGSPIRGEQVRLETCEEFPQRVDVARSLDEVIGRIPRRTVRPGMPVLRSDLEEAFQVRAGEVVEVTALSGAAQLQLQALAQGSGRQGDVIPLKNIQSGKTFRGRIEGKGKAIVMAGASGLIARVQ